MSSQLSYSILENKEKCKLTHKANKLNIQQAYSYIKANTRENSKIKHRFLYKPEEF